MLATFLTEISDGGMIAPKMLAERLHLPMTRLSKLAHVNRNVLVSRPNSPAVQKKLSEIARIITRVSEITENEDAAILWFKHQPIAGFAGKTAEMLVEEGRANAVIGYIESVDAGGVA